MKLERLQKVMAKSGIGSRRKNEELIKKGKVKVNGQIVTVPGTKVSFDDLIEVDGRPISIEKKIYICLNKPVGVVTTLNDPQGRKTVIDLLKGIKQRVYPVGRLDIDTHGLLILTNDGDLAYRLTHPKYEINKTYIVSVYRTPSDKALNHIEKGVNLEDGPTAPCKIERLNASGSLLQITIHEGRNRQIRRLFEYIGHSVCDLQRVKIGPLTLGNLQKGKWRFLTPNEVDKLSNISLNYLN